MAFNSRRKKERAASYEAVVCESENVSSFNLEDLITFGGIGVLDFLSAAELGQLMIVCRSINIILRNSDCWRKVVLDSRRRGSLILWRSPNAKPDGVSWYNFLYDNSCRLKLQIKIFLPEILGYSLVNTSYPDYIEEFDLVPVSENNIVLFKPVSGSNNMDTGDKQLFYSFHNPYLVYWIVTSVFITSSNRDEPMLLATQKLMSMNAITVSQDELIAKKLQPVPESTCITSPESTCDKIYIQTARSNSKVHLYTTYAELPSVSTGANTAMEI